MGKRPLLFIIIVCLFWLAGCEQAVSESLPTATAVLPQPTATATTPPTTLPSPTMGVETAVVTAPNTPKPTSTNTPRPTSVPFQLPTPSATPNPTPFNPISLDTSDTTYQLRPPDPDILFQILKITIDDRYPINWNFNRLLEKDMRHYYPVDFPAASVLIDAFEFSPNNPLEGNPAVSVLWPLVQAAFVQYLNQEQIELTVGEYTRSGQFHFEAYQMDIDGDLQPEWILDLETYGSGMVPVTVDENNLYQLIPNDSQPIQGNNSMNPIYIEPPITEYDVVSDLRNDLIWHTHRYCQRCKSTSDKFEIFIWDGSRLRVSKWIYIYSLFNHPGSRYDFADYTQDEQVDIRVIEPQFGNFECEWEKVEIHTWTGNDWQTIIENEEPPDTPECNLWLALTRQFPVDATRRTAALERAINQFSADDEGLIALSLVHQAMAYSANGQPDQAKTTLDHVNGFSDQSEFVHLVQQAYAQADKNPIETCHNLVQQLEVALHSDIGDYLYQSSDLDRATSLYEFGVNLPSGTPNSWMLCDLQSVSEAMLAQLSFPANQSPTDVLDEAGLAVDFVQEINLDNDPELEWVGILEPQAGTLLIMDKMGDEWQVETNPIYKPVLSLETAVRDITDDGLDDVFSLIAFQEYGRNACLSYKAVLLNSEDTAGTFQGKYVGCFELGEIDIDSVTSEHFQITRSIATSNSANILTEERIQALETAVLEQTNPNIDDELKSIIGENVNSWFYEELLFLLGYHSELSGDDDQAVATYLDLIQQAPSSPWSWLAWARLEPVDG